MLNIINWNTNRSQAALEELLNADADLAILQEVTTAGIGKLKAAGPPVAVSPYNPWAPFDKPTYDRWPLIVKLSDRVEVEWFDQCHPRPWLPSNSVGASCAGTIAVARISPVSGDPSFIAVSIYARWFQPHRSLGKDNWIFPDASAHRAISDLSVFIGSYNPADHRIIAAGDFNTNFFADSRFSPRAQTIVNRMATLGLEYMGPASPDGRQASSQPGWIPADSQNVPTYYTPSENPATASQQLDYVFVSRGFHEKVRTSAWNDPDSWGPSDHCRLLIGIESEATGLNSL